MEVLFVAQTLKDPRITVLDGGCSTKFATIKFRDMGTTSETMLYVTYTISYDAVR